MPRLMLVHDLEDRARRDVARHEVAVLRIPLFEEVIALIFGNALRIALVARLSRNPHAPAFAARRFAHQPQLVFAGDRRRVNLDELAVGVKRALLIKRRLRRPGADHRLRGLAEDQRRLPPVAMITASAGKQRTSIVRRSMAQMPRQTRVSVENRREKLPALVLRDLAFRLVAAYLLVERVEQLLAGGRAGEGRAVDRACRRSGGNRASPRACD